MQKSSVAPTQDLQQSSPTRPRIAAVMPFKDAHSFVRFHLMAVALLWGIIAAIGTTIIMARPWSTDIDVGGQWDGPYLDGFYGFERNAEGRFRWSKPEGEMYLPGVGPLATLELRAHGGAAGKLLHLIDGATRSNIQLDSGWRRLHILPRPTAWNGDVLFTLSTDAQVDSDRRQLGFVLDTIRVIGRPNNPPIGQGILVSLSVAFGSALAGWSLRRTWVAVLAGLVLTVGAFYLLATENGAWRLYLTDYTGRLALVLGCSLLVGLASDWSLRRLSERRVIRLGANGRRTLAAIVTLAFLLRFGALAYPLNFPSDLRFNLSRTWMVREGKFLQLFLPNAGLTPVQWKTDITVPRTPYYYLMMSPVTFLPGSGPELAMMGISSAIDALAVGLVGLLVLATGGGRRAALIAALLVATQSFALVVITSWGIYTTLLGQCLSLLTAFLWLVLRHRLHERRVQLLLAAAMTGAFLSHPAILLLLGATWALLIAFLFLRRDRLWWPTLLVALFASLSALVLYYGWHLPEMLRRSLPVVFDALNGGRPLNTESRVEAANKGVFWPLLEEMYGRWLLGGAAMGAALLADYLLLDERRRTKQTKDERRRTKAGQPSTINHQPSTVNRQPSTGSSGLSYLGTLLLAWGLIYPPFAVADARVTLNYKHILFMLPLVAILIGLFYGGLARYRWGRIVVFALMAYVFWKGIDLVVYKVMYAYISLR